MMVPSAVFLSLAQRSNGLARILVTTVLVALVGCHLPERSDGDKLDRLNVLDGKKQPVAVIEVAGLVDGFEFGEVHSINKAGTCVGTFRSGILNSNRQRMAFVWPVDSDAIVLPCQERAAGEGIFSVASHINEWGVIAGGYVKGDEVQPCTWQFNTESEQWEQRCLAPPSDQAAVAMCVQGDGVISIASFCESADRNLIVSEFELGPNRAPKLIAKDLPFTDQSAINKHFYGEPPEKFRFLTSWNPPPRGTNYHDFRQTCANATTFAGHAVYRSNKSKYGMVYRPARIITVR